MWSENVAERSGNEIDCALVAILDSVAQENPGLQSMILWSISVLPKTENH